MTSIEWFLAAVGLYAIIGVLFSLVFVVAGIVRVDPAVSRSPKLVRALFIPGIAGLWPLMLMKWVRASSEEGS